jgi:hypothetical protein
VNWSIQGSDDGATWRTLDQRDTQELNGAHAVKSFGCEAGEHLDAFSDSFD